ncbi:hypothetical protein FRC05_000268 [Tulasnella sp. 425]|nr:hypothetical protein FRC05_000268 [Tulasnella sp. 425]
MAEPDLGGTTKEPPPSVAPNEALPSERELELEVLLKERDEHLTRLSNEVRSLRRRLPVSEQASTDEPFTLPSPVTNLLLPLLSKNSLHNDLAGASGQALSGPASATVTAALTGRLAALHQENEELYELLKRGAVGRLHEEVRELRVTTRKLEGALQESHTIISQLKTELGEAYRAIEKHGESSRYGGKGQSRSRSPMNHYKQKPQSFAARQQPDTKPIPTGPRAFKKPRLSHPSQERPSSSGYRSNGRSTPPVGIKQEEDLRMKVEEDDYETRASGGKDDDRFSDYYPQKSEQYSQYSRSRSPTPKRLGSEASDWERPKSRSRSQEAKADAIHIRRVVLNEVPVVHLHQGPDRVPLTTPFALQVHLLPMLMKLVLALEATLGLVLQSTLQSVDEGHCQEPSHRLIQADATLVLHPDSGAHPHEAAHRLVVLGLLLDFAFMGLQGALRTDEIQTGLYALRLRVVTVEATDDLRPVIPGLKGRGNVGIVIRRGEIQIGRKTSVVVSVERVVMRLVPDGESAMVKLARNTVAAVVVAAAAAVVVVVVPIMRLAMAAIPARR